MKRQKQVTPAQLAWFAKEAERNGISSQTFQDNRATISTFLAKIGSIVSIDRSRPLSYPCWAKEPLYSELEAAGPEKINLEFQMEQWLHPRQEKSLVEGIKIHEYLNYSNLLPICFGLRELLAIKARGVNFFRRFFKGKVVFGWKGVVLHRNRGDLYVPYLYERYDNVVLDWDGLGVFWGPNDSTLRLK